MISHDAISQTCRGNFRRACRLAAGRLRPLLLVVLAMAVLLGCGKVTFHYDYPQEDAIWRSGGFTLKVLEIDDNRGADQAIDKIFYYDPLDEIDRIMAAELNSTGFFDKVSLAHKEAIVSELCDGDGRSDFVLRPAILSMNWSVPEYNRRLREVDGGLFSGFEKTDVYGATRLHISLVDCDTGESLLDREYVGSYIERADRLSYDWPSTKSRVIGRALSAAIGDFKGDLRKILAGR